MSCPYTMSAFEGALYRFWSTLCMGPPPEVLLGSSECFGQKKVGNTLICSFVHSLTHLFTHSLTHFFVHSFIRSLFDSVCGAVGRPVSREGCVVDGEQATCPQELTACPGACRGRGPLSWRVAAGLPGDPGQWSLSSFQGACAVGPRACILFSSHWYLRASTHGKALFFKQFSQTPLLGVSHLIVKFSGSKIQFPKNRVDRRKSMWF